MHKESLLICNCNQDDMSVIMTVGHFSRITTGFKRTVHYYGYHKGNDVFASWGSLSRIPYWIRKTNVISDIHFQRGSSISSNKPQFNCGTTGNSSDCPIIIVNSLFTINPLGYNQDDLNVGFVSVGTDDFLKLEGNTGQQIKLTFNPTPTGFL